MKHAEKFYNNTGRKSEVYLLVVGPTSEAHTIDFGRGVAFNSARNCNKMTALARKIVKDARDNLLTGAAPYAQPERHGVRLMRGGATRAGNSYQAFQARESDYLKQKLQETGLTANQHQQWSLAGFIWEELAVYDEEYQIGVGNGPTLAAMLDHHPEIWTKGTILSMTSFPPASKPILSPLVWLRAIAAMLLLFPCLFMTV